VKIGNRDFEIGRHTYIMGILNVTPDSFSDGGKWNRLDAALSHTEEMIRDGADIIDIGGESTRPGYGDVLPDEEEIGRVAPVIEAVRERFDVPISVDTYKSKVAEEAVQAGACLVNDIWGCKYDDRMARVIARTGAACCLMHNRNEPVYENYLEDVKADLLRSVELARQAGVAEDKIILDPGMGFGKTYEHNLILMNRLEILNGLGYPVLLGTSRKSMIGLTLDLPATDRVEGTLVTTVMGVMKGCAFVRVHDVKENARAIRMTEAILQA
jgi:dihydropteroate synthase